MLKKEMTKAEIKAWYLERGIKKPAPKTPHKSHSMTKWRTEVRTPAGTTRFYGVRNCRYCLSEEAKHPAGHFLDGLLGSCSVAPKKKKRVARKPPHKTHSMTNWRVESRGPVGDPDRFLEVRNCKRCKTEEGVSRKWGHVIDGLLYACPFAMKKK